MGQSQSLRQPSVSIIRCHPITSSALSVHASSYADELIKTAAQSEVEATLNLNAMNYAPNPWHVSFSYARALQNTCLKKWGGRPENVKEAQEALLVRAKANSLAQLGKYTGEGESDEAKQGMFVNGYVY